MNLGSPRKRPVRESVVPMINVVFLLLVFFLLTAQIAPPDPVEIALPLAEAPTAEKLDQALYLTASGETAWQDTRGAAAVSSAMAAAGDGPVTLRADARAPAADLAALLAQLSAAGARQVALVTGGAP